MNVGQRRMSAIGSCLAPGKFAVHATVDPDDSDAFCVTVPDATYGYAIHRDVGKWVSIGFGDLA